MVAESEQNGSQKPSSTPKVDKHGYRTEPDHSATGWPQGVPYIIGNEGCERFSYYGMRAILTLYLAFLFQETGMAPDAAGAKAASVYHYFVAGAYFVPILGAILADRLLGKYNTILWLSIVYTIGHAVLSLGEGSVVGTYTGLILIAVGTGGIKPCVSANVGDQFGKGNWHLLEKMYQAFYFIINFGSFFATLLIPWLRATFGWSVAFAVPGVLMAIATLFFWLGRNKFVHVPAAPGGKLGVLDTLIGLCLFVALGGVLFMELIGVQTMLIAMLIAVIILPFVWQARQKIEQDNGFFAVLFTTVSALVGGANQQAQREGFGSKVPKIFAAAEKKFGYDAVEAHVSLWRIMSIFLFVSMFWALFDQHGSTWVLQAKQMNLDLGFVVAQPDQIQSLNPLMVMILIPVTGFVVSLLRKSGLKVTALQRMTVGMLMTGSSFVAAALAQHAIDAAGPGEVSVGWQLIQYFLLTQSEVLVSITGLEFAYTQSPKSVKSTVMGLWLLTVTLGNVFVGFIAGVSEGLDLANFFWTFAIAMGVFGGLFALRAAFYKTHEYVQ